ncbi:MAG: preprotein translocase subunit YajC [Nitrospirae bacterium]|uniref:preprotein translocase subunit YajC n=1 Tax=Candidatus Magnetobacterium casense TaxID=1455061 RepID=UPI00058CD615|nr:preprotein translocase subunit YajC [Candidatus Magnetobacterium casensis]MBF0338992.1 preprotein translocase subunit YajC [Nitrospirota bacterium]
MFVSLTWALAWAMGQPPGGGGGQGGSGDAFMSLLPIFIIFIIFYLLLIRPQQKKAKEHSDMLQTIKKGDKVITSSGIYGLVEAVSDRTVTLKIAENVKVKFGKSHIAAIRTTAEEE